MKLIEKEVAKLLIERKWTLATAESCSGGLLSHRLTNIPGSSAYFLCGYIVYSNQSKIELLGVSPKTIESYGAVSAQTALEMAKGARQRTKATLAISVTGIAGPGGATLTKPVGLVYLGLSSPEEALFQQFNFTGNRLAIKLQTTQSSLKFLKEYLLDIETTTSSSGSSNKVYLS
ncbi:MAG: CinA family protein [Promethearchaeota archaeon]